MITDTKDALRKALLLAITADTEAVYNEVMELVPTLADLLTPEEVAEVQADIERIMAEAKDTPPTKEPMITNAKEALRQALILSITAENEADYDRALEHAQNFAAQLTSAEVAEVQANIERMMDDAQG